MVGEFVDLGQGTKRTRSCVPVCDNVAQCMTSLSRKVGFCNVLIVLVFFLTREGFDVWHGPCKGK